MPMIKIDHVISFSSEDSTHVANNLLVSDPAKKWKCKSPGEQTAVVVMQLEKASVITGIDIGNEHSAYIEVLVSRSGTNNSDYKVLLVASSFMTPLESRQSQNVNKVRMFTKENFSKPECDEKWDRIKIACKQPFNKHVQYGLSFITLHTSNEKPSAPVQAHIGQFVLRPESPDNLSAGSLFEKRKELQQEDKLEVKLTGAAAIREAASPASLAQHGSPVCKPKLKTKNSTPSSKWNTSDDAERTPKPRDRNKLLYNEDEEEPNDKIDKIMEKKAKEAREIKEKAEKTPKQNKKPDSTDSSKKKQGNMSPKPLDVSITTPSSSKMKDRVGKTSDNERKRKSKDVESRVHHKKAKKILKTKPFTRLLDDVVLVISGIQNPDRANLRTSALAMGAKYKPDWDTTSTHLICAFANTPKFNQVKGKGKIVTRKWVEDCYSQRKRLPWRRYALDKADAAKNESEDEICEEIKGNSPPQETADNDSEGDYSEHKDEGSDTEERIVRNQELQRLKEQKRENNSYISDTDDEGVLQNKNNKANSVYSADTDEEEKPEKQPPSASQNMNELKSLFLNKKFYIDYTFSENVYNKLRKYIVAYNGKSVDDPTEDVDVILTSKENSGSLKEINSSAVCLNPDWVWDCHNCQKLVPIDKYVY